MTQLDLFIQRMIYWCTEANLGYDQGDRWDIRVNGRCDCSSLTYWALWESNLLKRPANYKSITLYTGTIAEDLVDAGWQRLPANIASLQPGDVLLSEFHHVAVCVSGHGWGATLAEANWGERGATGNAPGDQTGYETRLTKVYVHSCGWDYILRLRGGKTDGRIDEDGDFGYESVWAWQDAMKTPTDGEIWGQSSTCRTWYPAITAKVLFDGGSGSSLIRAVQRRLGVKDDGVLGYWTVGAIQQKLVDWGYDIGAAGIDHIWGHDTSRALQKSINDGKWG